MRRRCLNPACGRSIPGWQRICDPCFGRLPFEQRRAIARAGQAKDYVRLSSLARSGAAWLRDNPPAAVAARRMGEREAEAAE